MQTTSFNILAVLCSWYLLDHRQHARMPVPYCTVTVCIRSVRHYSVYRASVHGVRFSDIAALLQAVTSSHLRITEIVCFMLSLQCTKV
jgi:hypothetical protein